MALMVAAAPDAIAAADEAPAAAPERNWLNQQLDKFRAYPHLHRAYGHMKRNQLMQAKMEMHTYLEIEPADIEARLALLTLLYRARDFSAVQYQAARTLVLDPGNPTALVYHGLAAQAEGRKLRALALFRQVYPNRKASPEIQALAANSAYALAFELRRFDEALVALDSLPPDGNMFSLQLRRGAVLVRLKRPADAQVQLRSALALAATPDERLRAASALGHLAQSSGDLDGALSYGESILAIDGANRAWLRITADIRFGRKEYAAAEQLARQLFKLTEEPSDRFYLANVLFAEQKLDEAATQYAAVAEQSRDKRLAERASLSLGYTEQARRRPEAAVQAFKHALAVNPKSEEAGKALGTMLEQPAAAQLGQVNLGAASLSVLQGYYRQSPTSYVAASLGYRYARQGDAATAARYFSEALKTREDARWRVALAGQLASAGNYQAAADALQPLRPASDEQRREVAEIYRKVGLRESSVAIAEQLRVPTASDRLQLVEDYIKLEMPGRALSQLEAMEKQGAGARLGVPELKAAGYLYEQVGNHAAAAASFRRALAAGDRDVQTRKALAYLSEKADDNEAALAEYLLIQQAEPTSENELALARAYAGLRQTGPALSHYQSARAAMDGGDAQTLAKLDAEIGNVYELNKDYGAAYAYWLKAEPSAGSPELSLQLAYAEEMLGMPEAARARLSKLDVGGQGTAGRLAILDQMARLNRTIGNTEEAAQFTDMALAIEPTAGRYYQRALDALRLQQTGSGRAHLEKALALAPDNAEFALQLAYLHRREGEAAAAIPLFERALQADSARTGVYADLAYANLEAGNNDGALGWFRKVIDDKTGAGGAQESDPHLYGMRQQVRAMTPGFRFNLYQSYRPNSGSGGTAVVPGLVSAGGIPSQGGAELVYQPEGIGYRNGRTLRIFGRALWSNRPESLRLDSDSVQGGAGIQYKPLGDANLYLSVERLIPIGARAQGNWLLRASWGYSDGYDIRPDQDSWNQTILYADASYLAQHEQSRSLYLEARHGRVTKIGDALMLTPHLTVAARGQRPDPTKVSYVEAGAGVSIKYLFNRTHYAAPRSSVDLVLQYRKQVAGSRHRGGWLFSAAVQF